VIVDNLAGAVFALSTAVGYREVSLDRTQGVGAAIHDFTDLAIADSVTQADVHLAKSHPVLTMGSSKYKCE
jgi:hypothetical protein